MTRLLHLTDLHFGTEREDLIAPLFDAISEVAPDLVAVSGDLTHRARPGQFRAAVAFLTSLGKPVITAPGNHDMPLWNVPLRLTAPIHRWQEGVPATWRQNEASAAGFHIFTANTADPWRIRPGILRSGDVRRIGAALAGSEAEALNILLCHHPIEEPPGFNRGETKGAKEGIARLIRAGLDITLSGHLHHWQIGLGVTEDNARPLLQIQTGTALCARPGEKDHGFSVLERGTDTLRVTPWLIDEGAKRFRPAKAVSFRRGEGGWLRLG